jgi:hypothetical protein
MNNDPKADLIYAILAMDSYNRGYGFGITNLLTSGKIGNYTIDKDSSILLENGIRKDFTAGFYAIAYRNGTDTVISYRGTDTNTDSATQGGSDARNGYGIALGATPDSVFNVATRQAELAAEFYQAVTGNTDAQRAEGTVLTGHSLGGGLAGYIGLTSGTRSVLFDHLPFESANDNQAQRIAA